MWSWLILILKGRISWCLPKSDLVTLRLRDKETRCLDWTGSFEFLSANDLKLIFTHPLMILWVAYHPVSIAMGTPDGA